MGFSPVPPSLLSHRIESPAMQGMTSEQPPDCTSHSAEEPIIFDGFSRVLSARRCKSAGRRKPRRNDKFVGSHQLDRKCLNNRPTHFSVPRRPISSTRNSSNCRSIAERRGFTTKSNPMGIAGSDVRRISLILLLARFRSCALPSFRGVVRPKRL